MNNGNFSSPNYPSRYGNNVECVWTINQQPGYLIKTEFMGRFDIEQDGSCSKDYIQVIFSEFKQINYEKNNVQHPVQSVASKNVICLRVSRALI